MSLDDNTYRNGPTVRSTGRGAGFRSSNFSADSEDLREVLEDRSHRVYTSRRGSGSSNSRSFRGSARPGIESRLGHKFNSSGSSGSSFNDEQLRLSAVNLRGNPRGTRKRQQAPISSHSNSRRPNDNRPLRLSSSASSLPHNHQSNHPGGHLNSNKAKYLRNRSASAAPYGLNVPETGYCVKIHGFNAENTNNTLLIGFLRRACEKSLSIVRHLFDHQALYIEVSTESQINSLLKLDGTSYGNEILRISKHEGIVHFANLDQKDGAPRAIELLKLIISERFNSENGTLDLSNISSDARLVNSGFSLARSQKARKFIITFLGDNNMDVRHLSLAGNGLKDLSGWGRFFEGFPKLQSLSLACNDIEDLPSLGLLRSDLFPELQALDFKDTPLASGPIERYRKPLLDRLPKLNNLNGTQCHSVTFAIGGGAAESEEEMSILPDLYDSEQTRQLVMSFLGAFFYAIDNDIDQLRNVYHPEALFSLSLVTEKGFRDYYMENRNLKSIRKQEERFKKLVAGGLGIISTLQNMQKSEHDKKSMVVDAWLATNIVHGGNPTVHIHIHGEFKVKSAGRSDSLRGFDRTILLIILNPDVAQTGGQLNCQIIHDMLCIRPNNHSGAPWLKIVPPKNKSTLTTGLLQEPLQIIGQPLNSFSATQNVNLANSSVTPSLFLQPAAVDISGYPPKPPEMSEDAYKLVIDAMLKCGLTWDGAIVCLHNTNGNIQQIMEAKFQNQIDPSLFRNN